jgi:hypothetical protein
VDGMVEEITTAIAHLPRGASNRRSNGPTAPCTTSRASATAMRLKVAANAHLGRFDEARAELSRLLAINPKLTIARFRAYLNFGHRRFSKSTLPACASPACRSSEPLRLSVTVERAGLAIAKHPL